MTVTAWLLAILAGAAAFLAVLAWVGQKPGAPLPQRPLPYPRHPRDLHPRGVSPATPEIRQGRHHADDLGGSTINLGDRLPQTYLPRDPR